GRIMARLCRSRSLFWFTLRQILVQSIARLSILLRLLPEKFGVFRVALLKHLESRLLLQIVFDFAVGGPEIDYKGFPPGGGAPRMVAIEQPLTRIARNFLF